jgi:thiamine biosynthesis lipoprotein ApbE
VTGGDIEVARSAVERVLHDVDLAYSRFRPDSEIVAINARAGQEVVVSPLLAGAIEVALRSAAQTDGLCDPTVGLALRQIGYDRNFAMVAGRSDPIVLRLEALPGWRSVQFRPATRALRVPTGVELDLGSTGKAHASDLAAGAAIEVLGGDCGVLVSLGGDIAVRGLPPTGGWRILMAEDSTVPPASPGEVVAIDAGGLATSSTTVRRWIRGGVELHHVVDPRTGLPAISPWRTVSVAGATCAEANAAATAALIRGASAPEWLETMGMPARFVRTDGVVVRSGGWPAAAP